MKERQSSTRPRRLLLCLDGVPFDVIYAAKTRGLFDSFNAPARLLSPFPTMTNIALSTMLRATPPAGYESLYFDRSARRMSGGISKYVGRRTPDKQPSSYMDELDYQEPLHFEFVVYVAPERVCEADFQRFYERFRQSDTARDYFAFVKATDGLLHIRGPEALHTALRSLDKILRDIHRRYGNELEIMLFSDHGMNLQENRRSPLQTYLRRAGFQFVKRFEQSNQSQPARPHPHIENSIAIPSFGLCGYAALYCADEIIRPRLAAALVDLEGVDFSLYRESDTSVMLTGARGTARMHRQTSAHQHFAAPTSHTASSSASCVRYRYEQLAGDPLQLAPIMQQLGATNSIDTDGYACAKAWSARTAEHVYPDALANLFGAIHGERVQHTADVLVSFKDGYYFGAAAFSRFVPHLLATHGNALRPSTNAFLMSTHRQFPAYVHARDARPLLRD